MADAPRLPYTDIRSTLFQNRMPRADDRYIVEILRLEGILRAYLHRFAPKPSDLEDLLHDTYTHLLAVSAENRASIKNTQAFALAAARNVAVDLIRRKRVAPIDLVEDLDALPVSEDESGLEEIVNAHQEIARLAEAVAELPQRCAEVFTLRKVYGLSQQEIAQHFGISVSTVEQHLVKAVRRCAQFMAEDRPASSERPAAEDHAAEPRIERQAAEWLVRRDREDGSAAECAAFETWLAADARHRKVYLELQQSWQRANGLRKWRPYGGVLDPGVLTRYAARKQAPRRWPYALAASMLVAVLATLLWLQRDFQAPAVYTTDVGGYQRVILHDGSTLQLNTDTRVEVELGRTSRQIKLQRGEAYFVVAHDPRRPFEVSAAGTAVHALGTQFSVRMREHNAVEVVVTEGRVALRSNAASSGQPSKQLASITESLPTIGAGEAALAEETGIVVRRLPHAETVRRLAWQAGELSFKGETLEQVVAEFNRYNRRKLEIADPEVAALQVGGSFQATDLDSLTKVLERSFNLRADEDQDIIRLSRRRAE